MSNVVLGAVAQGLLWAIMAIGIYITYRVLDIADLTAEGVFALGAAVVAHFVMKTNIPGIFAILSNPFVATIMAILAGMLAGVVTGILHTRLKIPSLLSGILTMTALYSINLRIMGKSNVPLVDSKRNYISIFRPLEDMGYKNNVAPIIVGLVIVIIVIALLCVFFKTEMGFTLRATGNNVHMARALGVNTNNMIILGLVIGNGLIGLSSALVGQFNGFADLSMGTGTIVIGLSSVIIGEVVFAYLFEKIFKRRSMLISLVSVTLGSILYRLIIAFVLKNGFNTNDLKLLSSVILAFALVIPKLEETLKPTFNLVEEKFNSIFRKSGKEGK